MSRPAKANATTPSPTASGSSAAAASAGAQAFYVIEQTFGPAPDAPGIKDGQPDETFDIEQLLDPSEIDVERDKRSLQTLFLERAKQGPLKTPQEYLKFASEIVRDRERGQGRFRIAREIALSGIEQFPDDAHLHFFYANRCMKDHNPITGELLDNDAEAHFKRAHALEPDSSISLSGLGKLYAKPSQGRYAESENALFEALRIKPNDPTTVLSLGDTYKATGQRSLARVSYLHAKSLLTPETTRKHTSLPRTIERALQEVTGKTDQTKSWADIQNAIDTNSNLVHTEYEANIDYVGDAIKLKRLGLTEKAIEKLLEGLDDNEPNPNILFHLGTFYFEMGYQKVGDAQQANPNYDLAIKYLQRAHEVDPSSARNLRELGRVYSNAGMTDEAEHALFSALDIKFNIPRSHLSLGKFFLYDTGTEEGHPERDDELALARACFRHAADLELKLPTEKRNMKLIRDSEKLLSLAEERSGESWDQSDFYYLIETWEGGQDDEQPVAKPHAPTELKQS